MAAAARPRRLESQRTASRKSRAMPDTDRILDRSRWEQKHRGVEYLPGPAPFLVECLGELPRGRALDLACGLGGNALFLAGEGFSVEAFDWSFEALRRLSAAARASARPVHAVACDLGRFPLPRERYDLVVSVKFLDRSLWPSMVAALKSGGALLLETYNRRYLDKRPDFPSELCLEESELLKAFSPTLRVARYHERPQETHASLLAFR